MSVTLLERLQQKVDAELEQYRSGLLSQGAQAVMDNAYELVIKSELAVLLESAFLSNSRSVRFWIRRIRWLTSMRDGRTTMSPWCLLCDTIYTAGNDAHRERLCPSRFRGQ